MIRGRGAALFALLGRALARANRDGIARRASALAFATLVSLVPLLAMVSLFVAQTMREDDGRTLRLIAQLLPYREESVVEALQSFVVQAESLSGLAIAGFLLTSLMTFFSVQETLFAIFGVTAPPSLVRRLLALTLLLFWGPLLIGSVYGALLYLGQSRPEFSALLRDSTLLGALPAVVTFVGLAMLYWRAANGSIRIRHAMAGSVAATLLIEGLKLGFGVYVASFTAIQRAVYGTFAIAFFFLLSIQLAWWMLLYGAEVAACYGRPAHELDRTAGIRADPWVALSALWHLAGPGRPSLDGDELAAELGLPAETLRVHLGPLAARGLLEAPITASGHWRLAVAPGRVRLDTVLAAYDPEPPAEVREPTPLAALAARLAGGRAEALEGMTLDDWRSARGDAPGPDISLDTESSTTTTATADEPTDPGTPA